MRRFVLLVFCAIAPLAHAATVRPLTTLHTQVVRLKDLFDDPAPMPIVCWVPLPHPAARSSWKPLSLPTSHAVTA